MPRALILGGASWSTRKLVGLAVVLLAIFLISASEKAAAAACTAPSTDYGTVTQTVNIPSTGNYLVLSRMKASSDTSSHNSYLLEIDGNTCVTVGDHSSLSASNWTWVDYKDGNTSSKNTLNLTAGNHTVKMIGREASVKLDRVIFTGDTTCVPTGTGDNCASPPDTTAPTVALTAPANGATVSGTVNVTATASDDVAVTKVELYVDSTLRSTDTTSPYSIALDTTQLTTGSHTIYVRAYDAANNSTNSTARTINVAAQTLSDLVITDVTYTPANPTTGTPVTFSAVVRNQGTAATDIGSGEFIGVRFMIGGTDVSNVVSYSNSPNVLQPGQSVTITASDGPDGNATWNAVSGTHSLRAEVDDLGYIPESSDANNSFTSSITINNTPPADTTNPSVNLTVPSGNVSGTINVSATASDNVGVVSVQFKVDGTNVGAADTSSPYATTISTTTLSNGTHTVSATAIDAAGNQATASRQITVNNQTYIPEDVVTNRKIDIFDLSAVASKYGQTGSSLGRADVVPNNKIDIFDLSAVASKYGQTY